MLERESACSLRRVEGHASLLTSLRCWVSSRPRPRFALRCAEAESGWRGERKFEVKSDLLVGQPVSHCSHKSVSQSLRSQPAGQSQRASQTKGIRGACHHHPFRHHHHHHLKRSLIHDACKYDLKAASNVTQVYASTISINQPAIDWTEVVISRHNMILGRTRYRCR